MSRFKIKAKCDCDCDEELHPMLQPFDDFFRGHVHEGHRVHVCFAPNGSSVFYVCGTCDSELAEKVLAHCEPIEAVLFH